MWVSGAWTGIGAQGGEEVGEGRLAAWMGAVAGPARAGASRTTALREWWMAGGWPAAVAWRTNPEGQNQERKGGQGQQG